MPQVYRKDDKYPYHAKKFVAAFDGLNVHVWIYVRLTALQSIRRFQLCSVRTLSSKLSASRCAPCVTVSATNIALSDLGQNRFNPEALTDPLTYIEFLGCSV